MRILSFNVQNLRLRRPGGRPRLDGARDGDAEEEPGAGALDLADRRLTARVIAAAAADVVCLQEVFDRATLDFFHDHLMRAAGCPPYPWRVCLPGNDGRGRDLALLSRRPLAAVESHAAETPETLGLPDLPGVARDRRLFRRDCLIVEVGALTLFLCHFKAPWPDPAAAWPVRRAEALGVRRLVERRFGAHPGPLWLVLGDLNEPAGGPGPPAILPLLPPFSADLLARLPPGERWSYALAGGLGYSLPDAMLASPALAARFPEVRPEVLRQGMSGEAARHRGPRLADVGRHRPHASDHAALLVDFPGL